MHSASPFHIRRKLRQYHRTASELRNSIRAVRFLADAMKPERIDVRRLLDPSLRYPALFKLAHEPLRGNVARSAALPGLTEAKFIRAAMRKPHLFRKSPEYSRLLTR